MSLQSDTNNDIFIIPSQSLILFSGSDGNPISLFVEPSGSVNFIGSTGSILKITDNLSGSLFSVNNISGLPIFEVFSDNEIKLGDPVDYALVISGSNVIITGSLTDKSSGIKTLVIDETTGVVHTNTGSLSNIGSGDINNVAFWSGSNLLTGSSNLYYDSSSIGLGIGISSISSSTKLQLYSETNNADLRIFSPYNQRVVFINTTSSRNWFIASDAGPLGPDARDNFGIGTTSNPTVAVFQIHRSGSYPDLGTDKVQINNNLSVTGSIYLSGSSESSGSGHIITYNTSSGQFSFTASSAIGGEGSTSPGGSSTYVQFNSASLFQGSQYFVYDPTIDSLNLGLSNTLIGQYSLVVGRQNTVKSDLASARGRGNSIESGGTYSHAEGFENQIIGEYSHAEGSNNTASAAFSHVEGLFNQSLGLYSHAEGAYNTASGLYSHAAGFVTVALGFGSSTQGQYTIASGSYQTAVGQYNEQNNTSSYFVVGIGDASARKDGFSVEVDQTNDRGHIVFPTNNAAPINPKTGSSYFDPSTNELNIYNGTTWVSTTLT